MHGRIALAAAVALAVAACGAPGASAVTFGAALDGAADNTGTCANAFLFPQGPSCTFYSGAPGPTFYAPASGTVTAVRVKTGNFAQGPMQIVVMASLYQNRAGDPGHPYFACCFVERYGPVFTPAPNSVTTVPTSLPMVEQPTPPPDDFSTNARGDFLAISVLAPNVPIPASNDGSSFFSGFSPAPTPQAIPAPSPNPIFAARSDAGAHILMNADLVVGGGGGGGGTSGGGGGSGGGGALRPLTIPTGGSLIGSTAAIPLTCVLTTACTGTLTLTDQTTGLRAARAKKVTVYGKSARFSIGARRKRTIRVALNRAGRAKLGRRSSITLTATATIGSRTYSPRVKLRRPARRR